MHNRVYQLIYSFHMPLFMTLSGYFSSGILDGRNNLGKRFRQLLVPALVWGLICLLCGIHQLNFWFLWCLFVCSLVCTLLFRWLRPWMAVAAVAVGGFLLFPLLSAVPYVSSWKVDFMLPFFIVGMFMRKRVQPRWWMAAVAWMLFVGCLLGWQEEYLWYFSRPQWFNYKEMVLQGASLTFDVHSLVCYLYRFLTGLSGSAALIFTFTLLGQREGPNWLRSVSTWGAYTLEIYILQSFLIEVNLFGIAIHGTSLTAYLLATAMALATVAVSVGVAWLAEQNRWVGQLFFGKQPV